MKRILLFTLFVQCAALAGLFAQQKISILGDSYSTFGGYLTPSYNLAWYNGSDGGDKARNGNDVTSVEQTWWHLLATTCGYQIDINNSYSGSTVCCTGYRKEDYSDRAFITRTLNLGTPDIILVFGGTNDSWAGAPIGDYLYAGWTKPHLYTFRPAFAYLMASLKQFYPAARIINITNSELKPEITNSMEVICRHYGITNIQLRDIEKQMGHPSIKGMKAICDQVAAVLTAE